MEREAVAAPAVGEKKRLLALTPAPAPAVDVVLFPLFSFLPPLCPIRPREMVDSRSLYL